jgi:hypothetical protein
MGNGWMDGWVMDGWMDKGMGRNCVLHIAVSSTKPAYQHTH